MMVSQIGDATSIARLAATVTYDDDAPSAVSINKNVRSAADL